MDSIGVQDSDLSRGCGIGKTPHSLRTCRSSEIEMGQNGPYSRSALCS
jgi:hypothetical protein